ncbi:phospholipid/cholesterol/gamma-HCH transport system substrate-binding protein [Herbihabitans rhizosphaerae]|uniref:Phospholipid/cholesterol/gamma-HCH transport system substrate-binding protein n=1 Tax=Herbihabitans rhizosphaerae TaxID=1872711 RepID=A0A4V2ER75_9PSEU|nr:MCE family protein [Herbihabitans rhizosphaerae]RZS29438.1 phospholipid/cholesterol/gamma-HCH transport system substrate-binding protein [Herbihabitans rhizosphaerae]
MSRASRRSARQRRRRDQGLGVVFLVMLLALSWLTVAIYDKQFSSAAVVVLHVDRTGNQLVENADVKVRGLVVGQVREVQTGGQGATVALAIDQDKLDFLPHNVSARLLPKTLFGQRYVSLVIPSDAESRKLADGDVIKQDNSMRAIELEKALRDLMPLLQAVQPHKLASTLGSIAQALDGRGKPLGETLVAMNSYLTQLNPHMPALKNDITKFASTVEAYERAGPDIIDALSELTTTAKTIAEQRGGLSDMIGSLTTASDDLNKFLLANKENLIRLSDTSRPTLELLARYAPSLPCLFESVNRLKPNVDRVLGKGTGQPGLHVELTVKPSRGKGPGPVPGPGPRCYPSSGGVTPASFDGAAADLGMANSPSENQFIAELIAANQGVNPTEVPAWGSLLVGPLLRGTEVTLR